MIAYVEEPFARGGSWFTPPLNSLNSWNTADLMERPISLGMFRPSQDPTRWN
ncbi:MAG: hypothetical protein VKM34_06415 [Cyanobacteriota bacterium]|nr:hypothetical protein [Cyanobacteriota bacterium]